LKHVIELIRGYKNREIVDRVEMDFGVKVINAPICQPAQDDFVATKDERDGQGLVRHLAPE